MRPPLLIVSHQLLVQPPLLKSIANRESSITAVVLSLKAEERRRRAAERQEAQRAREVGVVVRRLVRTCPRHVRDMSETCPQVGVVVRRLVREVEAGGDAVEREVARTLDRVVGRVLRLCDPRYAGLDSPEYAHAQLVARYKKKCDGPSSF